MRRTMVVSAAALLAACGGGARQLVEVSGPAPAPAAQTMGCVTNELDDLGFRVVSNNSQTGGSIIATRVNDPPWWQRIIGFRPTADQLTVTLSQGQLRVTAVSSDPAEGGAGGGGAAAGGGGAGTTATEEAHAAAQQIIRVCGRS